MTFRISPDRTTRKVQRVGHYIQNPNASHCVLCDRFIDRLEPAHLRVNPSGDIVGLICIRCIDQYKRDLRNKRLKTKRAIARDEAGGSNGQRQCRGCGEDFDAKRSDQRHCSSTCRQRTHRLARHENSTSSHQGNPVEEVPVCIPLVVDYKRPHVFTAVRIGGRLVPVVEQDGRFFHRDGGSLIE